MRSVYNKYFVDNAVCYMENKISLQQILCQLDIIFPPFNRPTSCFQNRVLIVTEVS
uniref:Uncharacterized protein n=1 Tax=Anguilla anguilla TaxID=7936 RepID=A0A0E9VRK2_ANGAN